MTAAGKVASGSADLDEMLGGGFEAGVISQIYGDPGSGKSTVCILAAVESLRLGKAVIYIDTEGFSIERFRQIAGTEAETLATHLFIYDPVDFEEQGLVINECEHILKTEHPGMIIIDSVTGLYRSTVGPGGEAQRRLGYQLVRLLGFAKRYELPVLVTNQVYVDIESNRTVGLGGTTLQHISKAIIRLEKINTIRRATLEKHRSQPEHRSFDFEIVEKGIKRV